MVDLAVVLVEVVALAVVTLEPEPPPPPPPPLPPAQVVGTDLGCEPVFHVAVVG